MVPTLPLLDVGSLPVTSAPIVDRVAASVPAVVTGLIADASAVILLFASDSVSGWFEKHWMFSSISLSISIVANLALMNAYARYRISSRFELDRLSLEVARLEAALRVPTENDSARFRAFMQELGPSSSPMIWIKETFISTMAPVAAVNSMEKVYDEFSRDPRGFDGGNLDLKFRALHLRLGEFVGSINNDMWIENSAGTERLEMPREWDYSPGGRGALARARIAEARQEYVDAYDLFLRAAQEAGLVA